MGILKDYNIVAGNNLKSVDIFENLYVDFRNVKYDVPSEYVEKMWRRYQNSEYKKNNSLNGKVFEYIINTLLIREEITPFYVSAQVAFVSDVNFDIILYSNTTKTPIVISIKTSLRERYKQADYESLRLKDVHKGSKSYLITLDKNYKRFQNKIELGHIRTINGIFHAFSEEFDMLISKLKNMEMIKAPSINIVKSNYIIQ